VVSVEILGHPLSLGSFDPASVVEYWVGVSRTILITGGAGFVGSNFAIHWRRRHGEDRIVILDALTYAGNTDNLPDEIKRDEQRFELWYGNVNNGDLVSALVSRSDVVVHFAAESHVARSIYDNRIFFETDVLGTQTIANAIVKAGGRVERFVHISTSEVYGTAASEPMDEDHPLNPSNPYAGAKAGADRLVYSYVKTYELPGVILRPFNQYGPRQHLEKVIPRFITSALKEEPLTIHGSGEAIRDWMYVDDTCARIAAAIEAPLDSVKGEAINLGSGHAANVLTIAKMILAETGRSAELIQHIGDRPGQVEKHISSTDKQQRLLGVSAPRPFEQGLSETIRWYADNRDWWKRLEWMKLVPIRTLAGTIEYH
jgi:dTDP-glucose 4,6-dehydratase